MNERIKRIEELYGRLDALTRGPGGLMSELKMLDLQYRIGQIIEELAVLLDEELQDAEQRDRQIDEPDRKMEQHQDPDDCSEILPD